MVEDAAPDVETARFVAAGPDAVLGYTIARLAHAVERLIEEAMGEALRLTVRQFGALAHLDRDPGLGSGALARLLLITPQSAGSLVDGLAARGLLVRDRSAGRGRVAAAALTPEGHDTLRRAYGVAAGVEAQLAAVMPPGETVRLNATLQRLLDAMPDIAAKS